MCWTAYTTLLLFVSSCFVLWLEEHLSHPVTDVVPFLFLFGIFLLGFDQGPAGIATGFEGCLDVILFFFLSLCSGGHILGPVV